MKWEVKSPDNEGTLLGRKCTKCEGDKCGKTTGGGGCQCKCSGTGATCNSASADTCKCGCTIGTYRSAYRGIYNYQSYVEGTGTVKREPTWKDMNTITTSRSKSAQILLGSVCLIWSGITYMYWTGKYAKGSPRWNNHILNGTGLDDGTLSQWLQALGFPRDMLNNHGPGNRWDAIIWDGFMGMLYLGFPDTGTWKRDSVHGYDPEDNTFRNPAGMNYAGYLHTLEKGAFCSNGNVFKKAKDASITDEQMHKCGALYKLYILSCAYFTGLQKRNSESTPRTPRTIREILYWLSALPYSKAYPKILKHGKQRLKEVLKKPGDSDSSTANDQKQLKFYQDKRPKPITVDEFNLFAHFQAVTQYCPLVLIGIQGGIHSTNSTSPAIHSLYANTECNFTYPTVSIQAYNQVVHYIRALFYQLYFLRKQCAVKVTCGGKWRECRYGKDVVSKGVISWMCLGCDPMDHDRKCRVNKVKDEILKGVIKGTPGEIPKALKELLEAIGEVVVQLGNAQEALERRKGEEITKVKDELRKAKTGLEGANGGLNGQAELTEAKGKLEELMNGSSGNGILKDVETKLDKANSGEYDPGKNGISAAIKGVREALEALKKVVEGLKRKEMEDAKEVIGLFLEPAVADTDVKSVIQQGVSHEYTTLLTAIDHLISICNSPKCTACKDHKDRCGQKPQSKICEKCHQQYDDGKPSPLQAFLEDRLPGFSCQEVPVDENPEYPPAASHLGHCGGSGQCCPLPMGFRGHFHKVSTGLVGAIGKVIEVVLGVVKKLVEGVKKKDVSGNGNVKGALQEVKGKLEGAQEALKGAKKDLWNGNSNLGTAKVNLGELSNNGKGSLQKMWEALGKLDPSGREKSLPQFIEVSNNQLQVDPGKNTVSEFIHKITNSDAKVIKALIDQLAQGLQKWVGWQEGDTCCLGQKSNSKADGGVKGSNGIGGDCGSCGKTVNPGPCWCTGCSAIKGGSCSGDCSIGSGTCCKGGCRCCHCASQPDKCRTSGCCCYLSAYSKTTALWTTIVNVTTGSNTTHDPSKVHLLARIFLGSVCLIWSGLSQLGFLTGRKFSAGHGSSRWMQHALNK